MNKPVITGIAAGILLAGIMVGGLGSLSDLVFNAQAQEENTTGVTKRVTLIADEVDVQIAPDNALFPGGVMYRAMVFNGTTPGPVISVDQGDTIEFTLINEGDVIHSMDFHAGYGPSSAVGANASATGSVIQPGESVTWTWSPPFAGVFFYHCGADGLNGVWEHIANGMYGGIVVHPQDERPAKEFYVVFGEIYSTNIEGLFAPANDTGTFDLEKFLTGNPDIVMINGMAHKYVPALGAISQIELNPDAEIFQVQPGELTRWYIVNAGPNNFVGFHFISGILSVHDGSVNTRYGTQLLNDEGWTIPPGSASVIESTFPEEGIYVGLTHAMNDVLKGAAFAVLATEESTPDDHPAGTFVPPRESEMVSGPPVITEPVVTEEIEEIEPVENITEIEPPVENITEIEPVENITEIEPPVENITEIEPVENITETDVTENVTIADNITETVNETEIGVNGVASDVSIVPGSSSLTDDAYEPNPVQASVGDTVTWTNDDATPHTVTSGAAAQADGIFDSDIMAPQQTFEHTFTEAGEFPYFCILHPNMVGTVSVS